MTLRRLAISRSIALMKSSSRVIAENVKSFSHLALNYMTMVQTSNTLIDIINEFSASLAVFQCLLYRRFIEL
jgi:hypothetical protein